MSGRSSGDVTREPEPAFQPIEDDAALDGNAAGGLLAAAFGYDLTDASGTCAHCGTVSTIAVLRLYVSGPGAVLRCPACSDVILTIVRRDDGVVVNLRGLESLRL